MTRRGRIILWAVLGVVVGIPVTLVGVVLVAFVLWFLPQDVEKWAEATGSIIIEDQLGARDFTPFVMAEIIGENWDLACDMEPYRSVQDVIQESERHFPELEQFKSYRGRNALNPLPDAVGAFAAFDFDEDKVVVFMYFNNLLFWNDYCYNPKEYLFVKDPSGISGTYFFYGK